MIYGVSEFVDERGFVVRMLKEVNGDEFFFLGTAHVMISTNNPNMPQMPQKFEFRFPDDIKSVEEAFSKFEYCMNEEFKRQKEEYQKKQLEKKIFTPDGKLV